MIADGSHDRLVALRTANDSWADLAEAHNQPLFETVLDAAAQP